MRSLQIKPQLKKVLGVLQIATPAGFLWRSITPKGRRINRQINDQQRQMLGMYRQFVGPGNLCFDVGANMGTRVECFLSVGAKIIAVEPQQICIDYLRAKYSRNKRVVIEPVGLDEAPGEHEFLISSNSAVSSMSRDWVADISKRGGKIAAQRWDKTVTVRVTTLDALIEKYGLPVFCKIDVEGFEYQVLKGLSHPIPALSLEYTPERIQIALDCVQRLSTLADYEFNYSVEETMTLALASWVNASAILGCLKQTESEKASGDVYARLVRAEA